MNRNSSALRAELVSVLTEGAIVINKRKLLILLGKYNDKRTAWDDLLDLWEELDQPRSSLFGLEVGDKIVLTLPVLESCEHVPVVTWGSQAPVFADDN